MSRWWMVAAALMLAACGGEETDGELGARRIGPDGDAIAVRTVNLSAEEESTYVMDVDEGRPGDGVDVVRRDGSRLPAEDWLEETARHLDIDLTTYRGPVLIKSGVDELIDASEYEEELDQLRDNSRRNPTCPASCLHCPEDSAVLCATLCGG